MFTNLDFQIVIIMTSNHIINEVLEFYYLKYQTDLLGLPAFRTFGYRSEVFMLLLRLFLSIGLREFLFVYVRYKRPSAFIQRRPVWGEKIGFYKIMELICILGKGLVTVSVSNVCCA